MSDEIVFYTNPMSRGRIVRWMLEEVGRPYRTEIIQYDTMKSPAYLAVNPMGKVPAIRHGDTVVTEARPSAPISPTRFPMPASRRHTATRRGATTIAGSSSPPVRSSRRDRNKAMGFEMPKEQERMAGFGNMASVVATLDQLLSKTEYVAGGRFSAADLYLGSHLGWGMQFGTIEKRPSFERYFQRLHHDLPRSGPRRSTTSWWRPAGEILSPFSSRHTLVPPTRHVARRRL